MPSLLLRILCLAALYCLSAALCQGLAIRPGAAIAFWAPAGIALGAMLLWGRRVWPGVLLGHLSFSYLFIITQRPDGASNGVLAYLGAAAIGATLQALAGATLVRRTIPKSSALDDGPTVIRFLLLAGLLSCLIGASLANGVAVAAGVKHLPDALREWVEWYVGDCIGVIVLAPMAQVLGARPDGSRSARLALLRVFLAVASATALTIVAFAIARRQYQANRRDEASRTVALLEERIRGELLAAAGATTWIEGLLLASEQVTRAELERFSEVVFRSTPAVCAVGIGEATDSGSVRILHLIPRNIHGLSEGEDLTPLLPETLRATLQPGIPETIPVPDTGEGPHTLVLLPVGMARDRPPGTRHYALALVEHAALLPLAVNDPRIGPVEAILEISDPQGRRCILRSPGLGTSAAAELLATIAKASPRRSEFNALGQSFRLIARDPRGRVLRGILPWAVLAWGMTFTGLLQAFLLVVLGQRQRIEQLVEERTTALHTTNRELAAALEAKERAIATANQALADAQAAGGAKVRFLATISHELRTPMNAIMGMAETIRDESEDLRSREQGATIHSSARNLLTIINDILDYARLESGKLELRPVDFNLTDMFDQLRELFAEQAGARGLSLSFEIGPGMPSVIIADQNRLRQILVNLIGNAIKFTSVGGVSVLAEAGELQQDRFILRIRVMDTGPGIDESKRDRLFQPFSQIDNSWTRRHGGSGLGLAICRQLTTLMGGHIELEEGRAIGSSFLVTLPTLCDTTKSPPRPPTHTPVDINFAAIRVLVVEDNKINLAVALKMLEKIGVGSVLVAEDGDRAVAQWRAHQPDMILMDLQLPGKDGLTATEEIRALETPAGKRPRIIAFTANTMDSDRQACMMAGMDDFLTKPFTSDDLARMLVRNLRELRQREKRLRRRAELREP